MSNASSTIQSDNLSSQSTKATLGSTQSLRTTGPTFAPDFAQVLQAFDSSDQDQGLLDDADSVRDPAAREETADEAEATADDADESAEAGEASAQDGHASGADGDEADQPIDASESDAKRVKSNDSAQGAEGTAATADASAANNTASVRRAIRLKSRKPPIWIC